MTVGKIMNRPPPSTIISQLNPINHQDSSCIDPDMCLKSIKKKINFNCFCSRAATLFFGVGLIIVDRIGDIRSILQVYLTIKNGNYNNSSFDPVKNISKEAESYIITDYQLFLICFALIISISFYMSLKSIANYWEEFDEVKVKKERKKKEKEEIYAKLTYWKSFRDPKSRWTVGRLVLHLLLLAPAARYM